MVNALYAKKASIMSKAVALPLQQFKLHLADSLFDIVSLNKWYINKPKEIY